MADRIITAVRVRPLSGNEIKNKNYVTVEIDERFEDGKLLMVQPAFYQKNASDRRPYERQFNLDHSFWSVSPQSNFATQKDVFLKCGQPLIKHSMDGLNSTIIAYGQTGSGKASTIECISTDNYSYIAGYCTEQYPLKECSFDCSLFLIKNIRISASR